MNSSFALKCSVSDGQSTRFGAGALWSSFLLSARQGLAHCTNSISRNPAKAFPKVLGLTADWSEYRKSCSWERKISELAAASERWKRIAVRWVAPTVLWLHTALPVGIFLGGIAASIFLRGTSGPKVSKFAITFFFYSLLPLSVLNETVVLPQLAATRELHSRRRWFALFLLLSGVSLQLISDLMGFGGASS